MADPEETPSVRRQAPVSIRPSVNDGNSLEPLYSPVRYDKARSSQTLVPFGHEGLDTREGKVTGQAREREREVERERERGRERELGKSSGSVSSNISRTDDCVMLCCLRLIGRRLAAGGDSVTIYNLGSPAFAGCKSPVLGEAQSHCGQSEETLRMFTSSAALQADCLSRQSCSQTVCCSATDGVSAYADLQQGEPETCCLRFNRSYHFVKDSSDGPVCSRPAIMRFSYDSMSRIEDDLASLEVGHIKSVLVEKADELYASAAARQGEVRDVSSALTPPWRRCGRCPWGRALLIDAPTDSDNTPVRALSFVRRSAELSSLHSAHEQGHLGTGGRTGSGPNHSAHCAVNQKLPRPLPADLAAFPYAALHTQSSSLTANGATSGSSAAPSPAAALQRAYILTPRCDLRIPRHSQPGCRCAAWPAKHETGPEM
ncbi:hypothetical protein EYF80_006618 [Liparis tanakae]|uniref:Uncharacterized protein n=1 Tax=Liparis tanakae TaxID=230148 RepID=A0A4Z2IYZ4_9TELE|nr:hypothetical protein EYF80_006618 [Liparis tanakae]